MMLRTALLSMLAGAAPAQERAFDAALLETCAEAGLEAAACDTEALAETLGLITASQMRPFGDIGMESFAMLTALRYAASALFFAAEGDGCYAEEERTAAIEIWSLWVRLPEDAPAALAERFALYEAIMDEVVGLDVEC